MPEPLPDPEVETKVELAGERICEAAAAGADLVDLHGIWSMGSLRSTPTKQAPNRSAGRPFRREPVTLLLLFPVTDNAEIDICTVYVQRFVTRPENHVDFLVFECGIVIQTWIH